MPNSQQISVGAPPIQDNLNLELDPSSGLGVLGSILLALRLFWGKENSDGSIRLQLFCLGGRGWTNLSSVSLCAAYEQVVEIHIQLQKDTVTDGH